MSSAAWECTPKEAYSRTPRYEERLPVDFLDRHRSLPAIFAPAATARLWQETSEEAARWHAAFVCGGWKQQRAILDAVGWKRLCTANNAENREEKEDQQVSERVREYAAASARAVRSSTVADECDSILFPLSSRSE